MVKEVGMPHSTSYSYATAAKEAVVVMGVISKKMGQASVAVTKGIYAHITSNVIEEAAQKSRANYLGIEICAKIKRDSSGSTFIKQLR